MRYPQKITHRVFPLTHPAALNDIAHPVKGCVGAFSRVPGAPISKEIDQGLAAIFILGSGAFSVLVQPEK